MRIGVISDTHRDLSSASKVIKAMGDIDLLIHAGDHYKDGLKLAKEFNLDLEIVVGNCDNPREGEEEKLIQIKNTEIKIFLVHGHQYGVKSSLDRLYYRALELGADIIIFGHTHIPLLLKEGNITILNPGSIGLPRGSGEITYALIEIDLNNPGEIEIKIKNI